MTKTVDYWFDADPRKLYSQAGCARPLEPSASADRDLLFWIGLDGTGRVFYLNRKEAA